MSTTLASDRIWFEHIYTAQKKNICDHFALAAYAVSGLEAWDKNVEIAQGFVRDLSNGISRDFSRLDCSPGASLNPVSADILETLRAIVIDRDIDPLLDTMHYEGFAVFQQIEMRNVPKLLPYLIDLEPEIRERIGLGWEALVMGAESVHELSGTEAKSFIAIVTDLHNVLSGLDPTVNGEERLLMVTQDLEDCLESLPVFVAGAFINEAIKDRKKD